MIECISRCRKVNRNKIDNYLDILSSISVLHYTAYRFFQSTMFTFYYSNTYKTFTILLLIVFGGIRYAIRIITKLRNGNSKTLLLRCLGSWILALPIFYVGWLHNYKFLFFLPICCMCLYDMDARKILKAFTYTIGILLAATILCALAGTVRNLVYYAGNGEAIGAYGIINTTDFASYFIFLMAALWCAMQNSSRWISLSFAFFSGLMTYAVYKYTDSRTSLICGILLFLLMLCDSIMKFIPLHDQKADSIRKGSKLISALAFPFFGFLIVVLIFCYGKGEGWAIQINNNLLSERLATSWNQIQTNGIRLFGSSINNMHGNGATLIGKWSSGYGYPDVAYVMLLIRYGWIITLLICGLWVWMSFRSANSGMYRIPLVMMILAIHAISEARILDVNYNIFLIMPFCKFQENPENCGNMIQPATERKKALVLLASIIACTGLIFVLPHILSWMRAYFSIYRWNNGTKSIYSVIVCAALVLLLSVLWRSLAKYWLLKNKKYLIMVLVMAIALAGGFLEANNRINQSVEIYRARLIKEEKVIQQVQSSADLPVYAADYEEIYQRANGGFALHLFSTDELCRAPHGTILADQSFEAYAILWSGGKYAKLSEDSCLYSYDEAVINETAKNGMIWTPFWGGTKHCDLSDTALFNNLDPKETLKLNGPIRVTTKNAETDQYSGTYEVTFSLSEYSSIKEKDNVILEVLGEGEETIICQESLDTGDFDEEGKCRRIITYQINDTPRVSFAITVSEGTDVKLEDISWRRVS